MLISVCDERARLLNEYSKATLVLSASVDELLRKTGTAIKTEYNRLNHSTDQARLAADQAHSNLEKHIIDHGCASHDDDKSFMDNEEDKTEPQAFSNPSDGNEPPKVPSNEPQIVFRNVVIVDNYLLH